MSRQAEKPLPFTQRYRGGWRGWWIEGDRRRYSQRFDTCLEAHEFAVEKRKLKPVGPAGRITLEAALDETVAAAERGRRRPNTIAYIQAQNRSILAHWEGSSPLDGFDRETLKRFIGHRLKTVDPSTVRKNLKALSRAFSLAIEAGHVLVNPVPSVRSLIPQGDGSAISVFSKHELSYTIDRIREAKNEMEADIVTFLFASGCRRSELARLRADDVKGPTMVVDGKTRSKRSLPVVPQMRALLDRMVAHALDDGSFLEGADEIKKARSLDNIIRNARRVVKDRRLRAHALRHSFASHLARHGTSEHVIGDLLGHKRRRSSITSLYISAFGPEYVKAMELPWRD